MAAPVGAERAALTASETLGTREDRPESATGWIVRYATTPVTLALTV